MGKKSLKFGKSEFQKSLKVFGWTVGSAVVVLLLDAVSLLEVPAQYAFIVPVINTVLYSVKEWFSDNSK